MRRRRRVNRSFWSCSSPCVVLQINSRRIKPRSRGTEHYAAPTHQRRGFLLQHIVRNDSVMRNMSRRERLITLKERACERRKAETGDGTTGNELLTERWKELEAPRPRVSTWESEVVVSLITCCRTKSPDSKYCRHHVRFSFSLSPVNNLTSTWWIRHHMHNKSQTSSSSCRIWTILLPVLPSKL